MQILFYDKYYDTKNYENNPDKFKDELQIYLKDFDDNLKIFDANIGHGADSPSIIIDIFTNLDLKEIITTSLVGLFFLGKKINKNLDAWTSIIDKASNLIDKLKPNRIDKETAMILALKYVINKKYKLENINIQIQIIPFNDGAIKSNNKLESTPDSLYIFTIKVDNKVFIIGIKSNNNMEFTHEYNTEWYEF